MTLVAVALSGCTSTLEAPSVDGEVREIYLMDHGRHPSLILPDGRGGAVRYAYGDWRWFAESETGFMAGAAALLWPTRGALGRQRLQAWQSAAALRRQIQEGFVTLYPLQVPAAAVAKLASRLDRLHSARRKQALYNPRFSLTFVPHPQDYWFPSNSNVVTARWLEELGVEVHGTALFSRWKLAPGGGQGRAHSRRSAPRGSEASS